ncbi:unnamed protein product [Angiostrongylus costaricensis]|uniref:WH1 domain-containing protein n=1 Tax=Angiostrongylus costaricensis TaxID=334426 RepID=A0A158PF36_ANGCS|nr:unnamed protein product [Angiostrongylus costaricensis]
MASADLIRHQPYTVSEKKGIYFATIYWQFKSDLTKSDTIHGSFRFLIIVDLTTFEKEPTVDRAPPAFNGSEFVGYTLTTSSGVCCRWTSFWRDRCKNASVRELVIFGMTDFNSTAFMMQLDAFGRPPPPQKLSDGRAVVAKEIASKLDMINLDKQRRIRGDMLVPSGLGMVQLGNSTKVVKRQGIGSEDVQKWRNDVLSVNRPRTNVANQQETVENAREHARKIADLIPKCHNCQVNSEGEDEICTRSDSTANSLPSPLGELTVTTNHERKYSDYSSASSQKSPTPPSQSSFSDYSSTYRLQSSPPYSQRSTSPLKTEVPTRVNVSSVQVNRFSATAGRNASDCRATPSPKQKSDLSLAEILSRKSQMITGQPRNAVGLTKQVRLSDGNSPCGRPPAFRYANFLRTTTYYFECSSLPVIYSVGKKNTFKRLYSEIRSYYSMLSN